MSTQRKPSNNCWKTALTIGLIVIAMVALHFTVNSDIGAWLRSIHG